MPEKASNDAIEGARKYVEGDDRRIASLIAKFPALGTWCLATALAERYGELNSSAIYVHIAHQFGVGKTISTNVRAELNDKFVRACRHLGLSLPPYSTRYVDDYVLQAGVADAQLPEMCQAFFHAEAVFGAAPIEDTQLLNTWEDRAADLASYGLSRLRQILWHDETAYHALVFGQLSSNSSSANSPFEIRMERAIEEARQSAPVKHRQFYAQPQLILNDDTLSLAAPDGGKAFQILAGGRSFLLRRGGVVALPIPWPEAVSYYEASGTRTEARNEISVWRVDTVAMVFDADQGRYLKSINTETAKGPIVVDTSQAGFLSRERFEIDGKESIQLGPEAFLLFAEPNQNTKLRTDNLAIDIRPSNRPRIELQAVRISRSQEGWLHGHPSSLVISAPEDSFPEDGYTVLISHPALNEPLSFQLQDASNLKVALCHAFPTTGIVGALQVELRLGTSERVLVKARYYVWPGLIQLRDGVVFDSPAVPGNLELDHSRYIALNSDGLPCLDMRTEFRRATIAFSLPNNRILDFSIGRPGVVVSIDSLNAGEIIIPHGSAVSVSDITADTLVIRTDDPSDTLDICGVRETSSFGKSGVRRLHLMALLQNGNNRLIRISRRSSVPIDLLTLERSSAPQDVVIERKYGRTTLTATFDQEVDAVKLIARDLASDNTDEYQFALRGVPVERHHQGMVDAQYEDATCRKLTVTISDDKFPQGIWIGELSVRNPNEFDWCRLESSRRDRFILALANSQPSLDQLVQEQNHTRSFEALNDVFNTCIDVSCWEMSEQTLLPIWKELGRYLSDQPDGNKILLRASAKGAPAGSSGTWVPILHPIQLSSHLYEASPALFSDVVLDDVDTLASPSMLATLAKLSRIRQAAAAVPVSGLFFMGFKNAQEAIGDDKVSLSGFSFERYRQMLEFSGESPGVWRPGTEMLTERHHDWAVSRFIDRLLQATPEGSDSNRIRVPRAAQILRVSEMVFGDEYLPASEFVTEGFDIANGAPVLFSYLAKFSRCRDSDEFWKRLETGSTVSRDELARNVGFLIRMAPELLTFYLMLWQLVEQSRHD